MQHINNKVTKNGKKQNVHVTLDVHIRQLNGNIIQDLFLICKKKNLK